MGILNYLRRGREGKTFQQLYEYWLEQDVPPSAESVLRESRGNGRAILDGQTADESGLLGKEPPLKQDPKAMKPKDTNSVWLRLPTRYVLLGAILVSMLLVTLSVVLTVLIMRSC